MVAFKLYHLGNEEIHRNFLIFLEDKKEEEFHIKSDTKVVFRENRTQIFFNKAILTKNKQYVKLFNDDKISGLVGIQNMKNAINSNLEYNNF